MNENSTPDLLIVGGGVVGLSIAFACRRRGMRVSVLDQPHPGMSASWAAAGMLSPLAEASEAGPFLDTGLDSLLRYPAWVETVEEVGGKPVGLQKSGKVKVASTPEGQARLEALASSMEAGGLPYAWCPPPDIQTRTGVPVETPHPALFIERDYYLDPRRLMDALACAVDQAGVQRSTGPHGHVQSIQTDRGRVTGVITAEGDLYSADQIVLAAGAWTGGLLDAHVHPPLRITPVLGQAILLASTGLTFATTVESEHVYLVPRGPDRLLVGATVEDQGFRIVHTAEACAELRHQAEALVPALTAASVQEHWSGLRPGTPDALPVIGTVPGLEGLAVASGHFRNGILLAPWTGEAIARVLTGGEGPEIPDAFRPTRDACA